MRYIQNHLLLLLLLLVGWVGGVFAQENSDSTPTTHLRIAHFSPDLLAVDVYLNGELSAIESLSFPAVTEWLALPAGVYTVAIVPAGRPIEDAAIGPFDITLEAEDWYTFAVLGALGRGTLETVLLEEDFSPLAEGNIRVSMFHAISDLPPINVVANEFTLVQTLGYPGFFGDNDGFTTTDIPAGNYSIRITPFDEPDAMLVDVGTYTLGSGNNYFIAAVGTGSNPLFVLVTSDMQRLMGSEPEDSASAPPIDLGTGSARVRVAHFAAGTPALDMFLNGELSDVQNVAFATISNWLDLPAGNYAIGLTPVAGESADAVLAETVPLMTDAVYTLAVVGTLENDSLALIVLPEDYSPLEEGQARLSVFHAAPGVGAVDVLLDANVVVTRLSFPGVTGVLADSFATRDVAPVTASLRVVLTDTPETILIDLPEIRLLPGNNYFVAAIPADPPYILVSSPVGE